MNSREHCTSDDLLARAMTCPFATVPLEIEAVLWEQIISLGAVAGWKPGDSILLGFEDLPQIELRIDGHPVGHGCVREGKPAKTVHFTKWLERS